MNKQDIEESLKLLENFTLNICKKFDIEEVDDVLEVRDYTSISGHVEEFDKMMFKNNEGTILYLIHFRICNDVFPSIKLDTKKRTIEFDLSYHNGEDNLFIKMLEGTCLNNLKTILPHFNMIICKIIDYKQSIDQHNTEGFRQTLQREFSINEVLEK